MLLELRIKDLALVDEVSVEFGPGLNILTGETGAGKTVVVEAINLLTGGRADSSMVRGGADRARVDGRFSLEGDRVPPEIADIAEIAEGGEVVVSRVVLKDGKSRCYLNGSVATVGQLAGVGEALVDLHGQHDQQSLFRLSSHLDFLDEVAGGEVTRVRERCAVLVGQRRGLARELEKIAKEERDLLVRKDLLEYQISEIEKAEPHSGEEERLTEERELLRHLEKIFASVDGADAAISSDRSSASGLELISEALSSLKGSTGIDPRLDELTERLTGVYYELEDCAGELRDYARKLSFPPGRLDEVESRLNELALLKKKYGRDIDEVLVYKSEAKQELEVIENADIVQEKLGSELSAVERELLEVAVRLSNLRSDAAAGFERAVRTELDELGMAGAAFAISLTRRTSEDGIVFKDERYDIDERGMEEAEFLISPNVGEALKPLKKIASGGEISRVMLALKMVLAKADPVPTMIFDEIDAGIGGEVANAIGQKLASLAGHHQVLVVTHLAQIARFAEEHFLVSKDKKGGRTLTEVSSLGKKDRVAEIARMLSGETASEAALRHAAELLAVPESAEAAAVRIAENQ